MRIILILCLLISTPFTYAQDSLTFTSAEANLTFQYPADWQADIDEENVIFVFTEDITIVVYTQETLALLDLNDITNAELLVQRVGLFLAADDNYELTQFPIGDREAARFEFANDDGEPMFALAFPLDTNELLFMLAVASNGDIEAAQATALEIATTATQPVALPSELTNHANEWQTAVTELEELGLIASGGSLIFQENRAFFSGQGNWFTSLASRAPRTDIVMVGTLRFVPGSTTELETCSLMSRIVTDNSGTATEFLQVGIDNDGAVFYVDRDEEVFVDAITIDDFDAEAEHHYLMLALDNTLTVYIDGNLTMREKPLTERSGTYGIGLIGRGPDALCEGLDIWAYEAPSFRPGVCEISAGSAVNKRSGPGTNFDLAGQLVPGTPARAHAQTMADDGFVWWQLDDDSWVRSNIVNAAGDCKDVPTSDG